MAASLDIRATEACVFDAYGTLFDVAAAARRCRSELGDKADPLAQLWRRRQLEYAWLRSLMGRHADFWQITGDALDFALEALGIGAPDLRARLMELYRDIDAYPDARATLETLRRAGRRSAILSNGAPEMLAAAVRSAGIGALVDPVLSIEEVGIYKPHRSVYELAWTRLGLPPERICFVSSNGWDVAAAAVHGLTAVWVNRDGAPRERLPAGPAAELRSLAELPALLGL